MRNNLPPLNYAILKLFADGAERCACDVIDELKADYSSYKLLSPEGVGEALATAKENELLEETRFELAPDDTLVTYYRATEFGKETIEKYI